MIKELTKTEIDFLDENGYFEYKIIPGRGIVALYRFIFTVGLVYGIDEYSYVGRYCYPNTLEAKEALKEWDGVNDPSGKWIKHKGRVEYSNPINENEFE